MIIPGAVYHGNRFACRPVPYPPRLTDPADLGPDTPLVVTDVPRLRLDRGPGRIQLLSGDCATPAIGLFMRQREQGFWLLTTQGTAAGDSDLVVEEGDGCGWLVLSVMAPGVREGIRYGMCTTEVPSDDRGADVVEGAAICLRLRLFRFPCSRVQDLYEAFALIRKDLAGPVGRAHALPFSAMWRLLEEKQNRDNWCEDLGFYAQVGDVSQLFGIGWGAGGVVAEYPLPCGTCLQLGAQHDQRLSSSPLAWRFGHRGAHSPPLTHDHWLPWGPLGVVAVPVLLIHHPILDPSPGQQSAHRLVQDRGLPMSPLEVVAVGVHRVTMKRGVLILKEV